MPGVNKMTNNGLTKGTHGNKIMKMYFNWDDAKNELLKVNRGISFEEIVFFISEGKIVDVIQHPNPVKYPDQMMYLLEINDYIFVVPFIRNQENQEIFLKTIYPSRYFTKIYLNREKKDG